MDSIYSNHDSTVFNFVVNPLKIEYWIIVARLKILFMPLSKHSVSVLNASKSVSYFVYLLAL
jgi:hypothetical protein